MSQSLLASRRFAPLFFRQLFAAFNDNFVKNALVLLILSRLGDAQGAALISLAGAVLIAPFFLFSALGGELADKYDKAWLTRWLSVADCGVALVAAGGFFFASVSTLFVALFLFGVTGALFGPAKYGILPDHLTREELPSGNALVESATFLAILTGAIAGGAVMQQHGVEIFIGGVIVVALMSAVSSWLIPVTTPAAPDLVVNRNILGSTFSLLALLRADRTLWRLAVVTSLFWLFGSVAMSLMPPLVTQRLNGGDSVVTAHLAIFAIAIALGSGLAAFLLKGRIVLLPAAAGAVLVAAASGALALTLFHMSPSAGGEHLSLADYFAQPVAVHIAFDLGLLAVAGGLMIVPAFAALQSLSPPAERARLIAAVNIHNAAFMALGGVAVAALQGAGLSLTILLAGMSALGWRARSGS